jgi:hypothetical protein
MTQQAEVVVPDETAREEPEQPAEGPFSGAYDQLWDD